MVLYITTTSAYTARTAATVHTKPKPLTPGRSTVELVPTAGARTGRAQSRAERTEERRCSAARAWAKPQGESWFNEAIVACKMHILLPYCQIALIIACSRLAVRRQLCTVLYCSSTLQYYHGLYSTVMYNVLCKRTARNHSLTLPQLIFLRSTSPMIRPGTTEIMIMIMYCTSRSNHQCSLESVRLRVRLLRWASY